MSRTSHGSRGPPCWAGHVHGQGRARHVAAVHDATLTPSSPTGSPATSLIQRWPLPQPAARFAAQEDRAGSQAASPGSQIRLWRVS